LRIGVGDGGQRAVALSCRALHLRLQGGDLRLQGGELRFQRGELIVGRLGLGVDGLQVARLGAGFLLRARHGEAGVGDLLV